MNQQTNVNLIPKYPFTGNLYFSQYDVGRVATINLVEDGAAYTIPTGATVKIQATKPSGLGFSVDCTYSGNVVTVVSTETMTNEYGRFPCELRIESGDVLLGTTNFTFNVEKSPHPNNTVDGDSGDIINQITVALNNALEQIDSEVANVLQTLTLGIDDDDGLLYIYVDGVKYGEGIEIGGSPTAKYTITYNLPNYIVSSSNVTKISENAEYHSVISSTNENYFIENISVSMDGADITATSVDGNNIDIASVTGNLVITVTAVYYPAVETDTDSLRITSGQTGTIGIRLVGEPTQAQTVTLYSDSLTLSESSLTFNASNWNVYQNVTITAPSVDDTTYDYVNIVNSDPLMTEKSVMVTVAELSYSDLVDTTIPTVDMHTVTVDDFTNTSNYGDYIRLYGYNAQYENIKIPSTLNGKKTWICCTGTSPTTANTTFSYGNTTVKYVTFEDGVIYRGAGSTSGCSAESLFAGCTNLIGVSNMNTAVTSLNQAFNGCTSLKFVDNLDNLVNVTNMNQTFLSCTALEYVQDLSAITGCGLQRTFRGCTSLKKIFGMPQPSSSQTFEYCFMQTQIEKVVFPANVSSLNYAFLNNTHVNHVEILTDNLATSNMTNIFGTPSQNIDVYANPNSTTLASLQSMFASSTKVTVHEIGSSGTLPSIVVWGDSTSSPNRSWIEWPARLQTKLGTSEFLVKNQAVSGEWTTSTSARQGGNAMHTNAITIPADTTATQVTLTTADNQIFSNAPIFNNGGAYNPCKIAGVGGTITKDGANYYFTRLESGSAVSVTDGTFVISDNDAVFNKAGNIMLVNIGHNQGWGGTASVLVNQMQLMVNHFLDAGGTDYIISGPWSGTWISTDEGWAVTQQVASLASQAFGNHWLDLPADMAANCQTDNPSVSWTAEDLEYIAAGKTPLPSLTYDNTHPTEAGANSQMMAFYRKGVELGYWE